MDTEARRRHWKRILDLGTGLLVVAGLAVVVHDRVLPEIRRLGEVEVGDRIPGDVEYRLLGSGDTVAAAVPGPAVHLVFQSTCPACGRTLPRWREILAGRPDLRAYAVGVGEEDPLALGYVREHLPDALAVGPAEEPAYLRILRIRVVPTTLLTDGGGRLVWRRSGVLSPAHVEEVLDLLDRIAAAPPARGIELTRIGGTRP